MSLQSASLGCVAVFPSPLPVQTFASRCGTLQARKSPFGGWLWRFAGLGRWQGDAESLPEALNQAAERCRMAQFEMGWVEVRA